MSIQFQHPPTGTDNPFETFNPFDFKQYPQGNGVYIFGLRVSIGNDRKFVPLYVGQGCLRMRLIQHYKGICCSGNSKKELWDFSGNGYSILDISLIYEDMLDYDHINNNGARDRTSEAYMNKLKEIRSLIFFQSRNYFNVKLGRPFEPDPENVGQAQAISDFGPSPLTDSISRTKSKFCSDFYFVYVELDDDAKISDIEIATKKALNKIGIHTTAKAVGVYGGVSIDFSKIQSVLINIGVHIFGDPYKNPLIITL